MTITQDQKVRQFCDKMTLEQKLLMFRLLCLKLDVKDVMKLATRLFNTDADAHRFVAYVSDQHELANFPKF